MAARGTGCAESPGLRRVASLDSEPGKRHYPPRLLKNVWPDAFVDETSLSQRISELRRALDQKQGEHSYIVTVPGRGYQFTCPVHPVHLVASE